MNFFLRTTNIVRKGALEREWRTSSPKPQSNHKVRRRKAFLPPPHFHGRGSQLPRFSTACPARRERRERCGR
eukprot:scaffold8505_cov258-Pinguiococcus_pyrenoidosus.AAC.2